MQPQSGFRHPQCARGVWALPAAASNGNDLYMIVNAQGRFTGFVVCPPGAAARVQAHLEQLLDIMEAPDLRLL